MPDKPILLDNMVKAAHIRLNKARPASACMRTMAGYFVFGTGFFSVMS
jgi:hypothetical protein